jgi:hypothetical protein
MLYTDRIKNLTAVYPPLSRVWIKTEDPRTPLKSVWIDEVALHVMATEESELVEDHLVAVPRYALAYA